MISIMLMHSGVWKSKTVYEAYQIDGIMVEENIGFGELISTIARQIGVDESKHRIICRYLVDNCNATMELHNQMSVKIYMEMKKNAGSFGLFPLRIITEELEIENAVVCGSVGPIEVSSVGPITTLNRDIPEDFEEIETVEDTGNTIISDTNNKFVEEEQIYKDKSTIKRVMEKFAITHSFNFSVTASCNARYHIKCKSDGCGWFMKSSVVSGTTCFRIRQFKNVHTCSMVQKMFQEQEATVGFVGGMIASKLEDPKRILTPNDIVFDMKRELGVDISYKKAWRAREKALELLRGVPRDGYKLMPKYIEVLNSVYPNSYIRMHKSADNEFMYLFVALYPLINGFQYCRPVVVVDGSFLRGAYKGTFLCASTLDGAGHILPLAYGLADSENDSSWSWFFQQFKNAFGERDEMCVVSDRHEGIIKAVSLVYPQIPHYHCIFHLWGNVCKNFARSRKKLTHVFYTMAKSYDRAEFDKLMQLVGSTNKKVRDYLEEVGVEKWARVHGTVNRGRTLTSNIAECINSRLYDARKLPILDFLEDVRILFGSWNTKNGDKARYRATALCDTYQDILEYNTYHSTRLTVKASTHYVYTVYDNGQRYIVNLDSKSCTCGKFQHDEIPCSHAIAVLREKHVDDITPYCSEYYKKETVLKIYEVQLDPMPDKSTWNAEQNIEELVLPPKYRRQPGRPKNRRHKNNGEKIKTSKNLCGRCGHKGHNVRTCNFFPKE